MKLKLFIFIIFSTFSIVAYTQQLTFPLANPFFNDLEKNLYSPANLFHTSVRPWLISEINKVENIDSVKNLHLINSKSSRKICKNISDLIFNHHLITLVKEDFKLEVDPVLNFEFGKDFIANDKSKYLNTRGIQIQGSITDKFSFFSTFYENQATFINYIDSTIRLTNVVPGQGNPKDFKNSGFDYAWASGYISYTPSKHFNFQFGHGKNFIGDGYRSLLLSDNAFNYPFLKITTNLWRFKYVNLYAEFLDLKMPHSYDIGFRKKYGTFHYLSYDVNKRLSIGLFESIIWKAADSTGYRGFDINYLNPIIFFRPVEFSLGSPDNALMGTNISFKLRKKNVLYGQLLLDEFKTHEVMSGNGWWANKQALQLGVKSFDVFGVKNLYIQTEYNYVRPYTYSSRSTLQNYAHYDQALAHPLGANFKESVSFLKYNYKRFFAELKFNYAVYGADTANSNYGKDIFLSYDTHPKEYGNYTGQGIKTTLTYKDFCLSYLINPSTNLNISLGISDRNENSILKKSHSTYVYFGIRTSLNNFYFDF